MTNLEVLVYIDLAELDFPEKTWSLAAAMGNYVGTIGQLDSKRLYWAHNYLLGKISFLD